MINNAESLDTLDHGKHPKGLRVLFFAELWERFGFYCIQSLLLLYLSKVFLFSDNHAYILFSAFSALILTTPVIGGYIADNYIGHKTSVLLGGVLYLIGYTGLSIPNNSLFYVSLGFIIWGNGFFKSCVSTLVGTLYAKNDPRRDSGFTLFYMGINIGSFLSPIICTYVAVTYGWTYGFATAAIGMVICLINCSLGFKLLGERGNAPDPLRLEKKILPFISARSAIFIMTLFAVAITSYLLNYSWIVNWGEIVFSILSVLTIFGLSFRYDSVERKKLLALVILIVFSVFFWAFYNQTFMSFTLLIDRNVDRTFFGYEIPTAMFQSINPFYIIALSPMLARFWIHLGKSSYNPSLPSKFALGLFCMGLGFFVLTIGLNLNVKTGVMGASWIFIMFFLQTIGELALSPIGLSAVTQLSPSNLTGFMMGIWFLSIAAGYAVGGRLAELTSLPTSTVSPDPTVSAQLYSTSFWHFGLASIVFAIILWMMKPWLKTLMK